MLKGQKGDKKLIYQKDVNVYRRKREHFIRLHFKGIAVRCIETSRLTILILSVHGDCSEAK